MPTKIQKILEKLLSACLFSFDKIEVEEKDEVLRFNVTTPEPKFMIGKHGENLFALQQILRLLVRKQFDEGVNIVLDIDDYRKNQERNSELIAKDLARKVLETGMAQEMYPMSSYRRRAIHLSLAEDSEFKDLKVYSVGEGTERRIRIEKINKELFEE